MPCWTLATFLIYQKDEYNNNMEKIDKTGGAEITMLLMPMLIN